MTRGELNESLQSVAESVAAAAGLELVEVELKGGGRHQLLRVTIDRPGPDGKGSVTHADCETVSREIGARLDAGDLIPSSYELEVSSPGVERKLKKWADWRRFQGHKAKVVLKEAISGDLKHFDGVIASAAEDETGARAVTVQLGNGREVTFPPELVDRANLKFEW